MRFKNKIVLVTGGSSGIGFAIAKQFSREGARVLIASRDEKKGMHAAAKLKAEFITCDVADEQNVKSFFLADSEKARLP